MQWKPYVSPCLGYTTLGVENGPFSRYQPAGLSENNLYKTRIPRRRISQRKAFLKTPHFRCKNRLFEPIFHQFQAEIATFHPLWMNFGVFRQTYDFTQWVNRKTSDWDTMLKFWGKENIP